MGVFNPFSYKLFECNRGQQIADGDPLVAVELARNQHDPAFATSHRSAINVSTAAFALPSTGGALTRSFSARRARQRARSFRPGLYV